MRGPNLSSGRAVVASERVYRALMRAYPRELRAGYGQEMARCFRDLCRREVGRRGVAGLVLLWARTLPELMLTALKERSVMIARDPGILTPAPATAARLGVGAALAGGAIGISYYLLAWVVNSDVPFSVIIKPPFDHFGPLVEPLFTTGFFASPLRYATNYSAVHPFITTGFFAAQLLCVLGLLGLYGATIASVRRVVGHGLALAGGALGIVSAALWLAVGGYQVAWQLVPWLWHVTDYDRVSGALTVGGTLCWVSGHLLLGIAAWRARLPWRLRCLPLVAAASLLTSIAALSLLDHAPHLGLVGYGAGEGWLRTVSMLAAMLPFLGSLFVGLVLLRDVGDVRADGFASAVAGAPGSRGTVAAPAPRILGRPRPTTADAPATEGEREKEVLEALRRHDELTVAGVALETSLTVEEADRLLSVLAVKGHLEVRTEHGRLLYSLWRSEG